MFSPWNFSVDSAAKAILTRSGWSMRDHDLMKDGAREDAAILAPPVGRWADRDRGAMVMQTGGFGAAVLLLAWTLLPGLLSLYIVWAGLGFCMAATLYESAFAIVGRAYADPTRRLRALAAVTLFGGLASTLFLPGVSLLVSAVGWRGAVAVMAALLLVSTSMTRALVFHHLAAPPPASPTKLDGRLRPGTGNLPFVFIATMFTLVSVASAAFIANLIPALGERGVSPARAALLGGLMGVMQLPGRALLMNGMLADSPARLIAVSLVLQAAGLGAIALAPSVLVVGGGTVLCALGAGLTSLARPHVIQTLFSIESGGYLNGRIARQQQLARAVGPIAIAWLAGSVGYATVFAAIAGTFTIVALASHGVLGGIQGLHIQKETI